MTAIDSAGTGGNWNDTASWNPAQIPTAGDRVTILAGDTITLTQNELAGSVTINSTGIIVGGGYKLTLNDAAGSTFIFSCVGTISAASTLDIDITGGSADRPINEAGTGSINNLLINNSQTYKMHYHLNLLGTLTISAGTLTTYNGSSYMDLTVLGDCTVAGGTLEGNASSGATVRLKSLTVSSGTYSATGGETIITGETSAGRAVDIVGTFTHNSGTLAIQTPADTLLRWPSSSSLYHLRINNASCIARPTGDNKPLIAGNLTISAGEFNTLEGGQDHALTVGGQTHINGGTLTCNASTLLLGQTDLSPADSTWGLRVSSGTFTGGSGGHTISSHFGEGGTVTLTSGDTLFNGFNTSSASPLKVTAATWSQTAGKVIFNGTNQQSIHLQKSIQFHDVEFKFAYEMKVFNWGVSYNITIGGTLTIDASSGFNTAYVSGGAASDNVLTVSEAATINGTLDTYGSGGGKATTLGSLTIGSGGTYKATSGTTTITNETGGGYAIFNTANGTFTHSSGTVHISMTSKNTLIFGMEGDDVSGTGSNAFNNLTVTLSTANRVELDPAAGTAHVIKGDLTIVEGLLYPDDHAHTLTVEGDVSVESGGTLGHADRTGADTFGNIFIDAGGTCIASEGITTITSAKSNFAISNSGTFTHNDGTVTISGGSNQWLNNGPYFNLISNNDSSIGLGLSADVTVANDLTVNASKNLGWVSPQYTLTVTGDVLANGFLNKYNSASTSGACSFGSLTIAVGGTYFATSGETSITGAGGISRAGTFTHNNGTVDFEAATTVIQDTTMTGSNAFYILKSTGNTWYRIDQDIDIERHASTGYVFWFYGNVTVTMGTDTYSSGTDNSNKCIGWTYVYGHSTSTYKLYAKNELYPWLYDYPNVGNSSWINGSQNSRMGSVCLKWGNIIGDFTVLTAAGAKSIKIDGDMEFDGLTIQTNNTLDLNGQRVEFGGLLNNQGILTDGGDKSLVVASNIDTTGTTRNISGASDLILTGSGNIYWGATGGGWNTAFFNGGAFDTWAGQNVFGTCLIGSGDLDVLHDTTFNNIQVASGGTLDGNSSTLTLEGDLTMSGGLLGASALDFNGAGEYAAKTSASAMGFGSAFTIEFWFKTTFNGSSTVLDIAESSGNDNRITVLQSPSEMAFKVYNSGGSSFQLGTTAFAINPDDGKWHHLAYTNSGSEQNIYYDGRLAGQSSHTITRDSDPSMTFYLGKHTSLGGNFFGSVDEFRIWSDVRTPTELKDNMFTEVSDSSSDLEQYHRFNTGAGTTASASAGSSLGLYDGGSSSTGLWAGAGTYDKTNGPAIVMAGTTQDITCKNGLDIFDLTINDGSTTSIHTIDNSAGRLDVYGNLTVNEKLTSSASSNTSGITMKTAAKTLTVASDVKTTALATLYQVILDHGGTTEIGEMNLKLVGVQSGATLKATGDFTVTTELEIENTCTLNANGKTLTCKYLDMNGASTLDLENSTLILSSTDGLTSHPNVTLNGGPGATVSGSSAATTFESQNNFAIVGKIENLDVTNQELNIMGQVINCTGDIIQQHQTQDSAQQLDYDTADDRDVMLGRDLDKNTELVG